MKPAGYKAGTKYPTLLIIHGGPNSQDQHSFSFDREFLAANGYVVLAINYRGSAGRGNAYQKAIFGDWGNLEVVDLLVRLTKRCGRASPIRIALASAAGATAASRPTHTIATDTRFKAAVSGAGVALYVALRRRSVHHSVRPGDGPAVEEQGRVGEDVVSAFFNADKIKTPTLFLGGEKDFNVPIAGGEQMYQALKSLGVDTQLVIYPGQFHGLTIPSYERDRLQRYLNWFNLPPPTHGLPTNTHPPLKRNSWGSSPRIRDKGEPRNSDSRTYFARFRSR